jgi:hypothetical protein
MLENVGASGEDSIRVLCEWGEGTRMEERNYLPGSYLHCPLMLPI